MIGTGDVTFTMAATPVAVTGNVDHPSKPMRVAGTFLVTVTWNRFTGKSGLRLGMLNPVGFAVYFTVSLAVLNAFRVWA